MKNWNTPAVDELNVSATAHNWTGIYRDGGYIGDGEISGHATWTKPSNGSDNGGNDTPSMSS